MRDPSTSRWAISAAVFVGTFGMQTLSSREFLRALLGWAWVATIAWPEARQALLDARDRIQDAASGASRAGLSLKVTAPWSRPYVSSALQALNGAGKELHVNLTKTPSASGRPPRQPSPASEQDEEEVNAGTGAGVRKKEKKDDDGDKSRVAIIAVA